MFSTHDPAAAMHADGSDKLLAYEPLLLLTGDPDEWE